MDTTDPITIDVIVDRPTAKDVLGALLHIILFHRLFGVIKPTTIEVLDVTVPVIDDDDIDQLVRAKVDAIFRGLDLTYNRRGQLLITFCEKRPKRTWFTSGEEDVPWEQWIINVEAQQPTDPRQLHLELSQKLSSAVKMVLEYTASERGRAVIPLITKRDGISPFPYHIIARVGGKEVT